MYGFPSGDLFDMLLPMLGIYQEYVRNHHYSLQVLAEYKQKPEFNQVPTAFVLFVLFLPSLYHSLLWQTPSQLHPVFTNFLKF